MMGVYQALAMLPGTFVVVFLVGMLWPVMSDIDVLVEEAEACGREAEAHGLMAMKMPKAISVRRGTTKNASPHKKVTPNHRLSLRRSDSTYREPMGPGRSRTPQR
jgi:hypothetical protein